MFWWPDLYHVYIIFSSFAKFEYLMLWVYDQYKLLILSARRPSSHVRLTSIDVRFWDVTLAEKINYHQNSNIVFIYIGLINITIMSPLMLYILRYSLEEFDITLLRAIYNVFGFCCPLGYTVLVTKQPHAELACLGIFFICENEDGRQILIIAI